MTVNISFLSTPLNYETQERHAREMRVLTSELNALISSIRLAQLGNCELGHIESLWISYAELMARFAGAAQLCPESAEHSRIGELFVKVVNGLIGLPVFGSDTAIDSTDSAPPLLNTSVYTQDIRNKQRIARVQRAADALHSEKRKNEMQQLQEQLRIEREMAALQQQDDWYDNELEVEELNYN